MPPSVKGAEQDNLPVGTVAPLKPPLSAQVTTFCSSDDSDGCTSRDSTASSCPAVASRSCINCHSAPTSTDKVRERYFHRLGIAQLDTLHQRALTASPTFTPSCLAPEKKIGYYVDKVKHESLRHSSSQGDIPASTSASQEGFSRHDEIILL